MDHHDDGALSCPIDLAVLERSGTGKRSSWRCPVCDWQTTTD